MRVSDIIGCLEALRPGIDGAVLGVPVADTLKKVDEAGVLAGTVPRAGLWRAQTPQIFRFAALLAAHRAAASLAAREATALTDDAAVAERAGLRVVMVEGHDDNRKITTDGRHGLGNGNAHRLRLRRARLRRRQPGDAGRHRHSA